MFTSPVAVKVVPATDGVVRGKSALRHYWARALERQGTDTIVIAYRNQDGGLVSEVLRFGGDLVVEGHGTYLVPV